MEKYKHDGEVAASLRLSAEDDVDLVVLDVRAHEPGFYMNRTRTYFVAQDGAVYLVRAPGQPATLQREDDLPPDCDPSVVADEVLAHLAAAADIVGRRGLGQAVHKPTRPETGLHDAPFALVGANQPVAPTGATHRSPNCLAR